MGNVSEIYSQYQASKDRDRRIENSQKVNLSEISDSSSSSHFSSNKRQNQRSNYQQSPKKHKKQSIWSSTNIQPKNSNNIPKYATKTKQHNQLTRKAQKVKEEFLSIDFQKIASQDIYLLKKQKATYQGNFLNELSHGKGIVHFLDGSYYQGDFYEGEAHGKGLYIFQNGSYYEGHFKKSLFDGQGMMNFQDNKMIYKGFWKKGVPHGFGTEETPDTIYKGNFIDGLKNGQGQYQWADRRKYEGSFKDGQMNGFGTLFDERKQIIYSGQYSSGKMHGKGILSTKNGTMKGNFHQDFLEGYGSFLWNDGKVYLGEFMHSQMSGFGKIYFPSGQQAAGQWDNGHNVTVIELRNSSSALDKIRQTQQDHQILKRTTPIRSSDLTRFDSITYTDIYRRESSQID